MMYIASIFGSGSLAFSNPSTTVDMVLTSVNATSYKPLTGYSTGQDVMHPATSGHYSSRGVVQY